MFGCLGLLIGLIVALYLWIGPLFMTATKRGFLDPQVKRNYEGNSMTNLKDIHTALMLYQESEGQLPYAESWMDATWPRLQTGDMPESEAKRKLKSPSLFKENPQAYGYAFNENLSGKHTADVPEPDQTPLVFDSSDLTWNAYGNMVQLAPNPARPEGNLSVTASGNVLKLVDLLK
jgi:hypothetical protein